MNFSGDSSDAARQLAQELENWSSDQLKGALKMHCKMWLAARMKFKDVKICEMAASWSQIWKSGCKHARQNAAAWKVAAKGATEVQYADGMTDAVNTLEIEMEPVFEEILGM